MKNEMEAIGILEIRVGNEDIVALQIEAPGVEGYIIGRSDNESNYLPDIDLADYSARQKGVSRRHAALVRYRGRVHLLDLKSVNGTFLNGERLLPEVPYPLNEGDRLSVANLKFSITQNHR